MTLPPWRYSYLVASTLLLMISGVSSQSEFPTEAPTPTDFPDFNTTAEPTATPVTVTVAPTSSPTPDNTTAAPTLTPTPGVTTDAPTAALTANVTDNPTASPSVEVVATPSPSSNSTPNATNSMSPSEAPSVAPTAMPTTSNETEAPTNAPTVGPTSALVVETVDDLSMRLFGIRDLPIGADSDAWEIYTAEFQKNYYEAVMNAPITDFQATVTIQRLVLPSSSRNRDRGRSLLRNLQQESSVTVFYTQTMQYREVGDSGTGPIQVATVPFESEVGRNVYVELLNDSGIGILSDITGTTPVETATLTPSPTSFPTAAPTVRGGNGNGVDGGGDNDANNGLSTGAIAGIAVGGGAALIGLLLFFFFRSGDNDYEGANDPPPSVKLQLRSDDVSTLAPPQVYGGAPPSNESVAGYGDQSVATVDYDYSKAYGGGGDTSVSSAGGTFGSQTHGQSVLDPRTAGATGAALGSFSDADSFEAAYRDPNANVKEELLHIFAPPGKLGVVIDTPDDGAPVVHAVKDSSVIADKIVVGDKLVAVDDEDVRSMTAIKVSKLISRKSANPSRKLTIIRMTVVE